MTKQEKQTLEQYRARLGSDPRWATRAIVVLHDRQTPSERSARTTEEHNRMGFSQFDAEILSSFAEQINAGRTLSAKQLATAYKRLPKYAAQLYRVAEGKGKVKVEPKTVAEAPAAATAEKPYNPESLVGKPWHKWWVFFQCSYTENGFDTFVTEGRTFQEAKVMARLDAKAYCLNPDKIFQIDPVIE